MMMMMMSNNGMPSASMEQAARRMSMAGVACAGRAGQGLGQPPPSPFTAAQQQALMRLTGGLQYNHMTVNANMSMPMHAQPYQYQYQHTLMAQVQAQAHHAQAQRQAALGSGAGLRYTQHDHTPAMSHAAAAAALPFQHSSPASIIHDKDHEELHRRHHADQQQQQQKPQQAHSLAHTHHHHPSQGIGIGLPTPRSRPYHFLGGEPTKAYRIVTQSQVAQLGGTPISAKLPTPAVPKQSRAPQSVAEGLFASPTAVLASKPFGAVGSASDSPVKHEQDIIIGRGACLNMQDSSSPLPQYTHIEPPQGNTSVIMDPGSSPASNTHAALQHQHEQRGLSSASFAANAGSERAGGNADGNGVPSTSQHATMATPSAASTRSSVTPPLLEIDNTRKTTHPSQSQMSYDDRLSDANSNSGNQNNLHTNANAMHVLPSSSTFASNTQDATTQAQSHHSQERRNAQSTGGSMISPTSANSSTSVLSLSSPVTGSHTMPRRKSTNTTDTRMDNTRNGNNNNPTAASLPMEDRRQTGSKVPSIRRMTVKKPALTVDTTSHAGPVNSMQAAPILVASPVRRQQSIIRQPQHQQRQALYEQQHSRPMQELPPQAQMMQMQPMVQQGETVYGSIAVQSTQGVSVQYPAYTVGMPQMSTPAMYA